MEVNLRRSSTLGKCENSMAGPEGFYDDYLARAEKGQHL